MPTSCRIPSPAPISAAFRYSSGEDIAPSIRSLAAVRATPPAEPIKAAIPKPTNHPPEAAKANTATVVATAITTLTSTPIICFQAGRTLLAAFSASVSV